MRNVRFAYAVRWMAIVQAVLVQAALATESAPPIFPGETWTDKTPEAMGLDGAKLASARDYALTGEGSGMIVKSGYAVLRWGDQAKRYDLKSSTKSLGSTLLGVAILDGKIQLDDLAIKHQPSLGIPPEENSRTGWLHKITIRHLATQTAGFQKVGGYTALDFAPGTKWQYSDGGPNWLAECITLAYRKDCQELMFERVCNPLGIKREDFVWRKNAYRPAEIEGIPRREFGSGVSANVNALARIGLMYLRGGVWKGQRILPAEFVKEAGTAAKSLAGLEVMVPDHYGHASSQYGLLWWTNADGTLANVPRDAFWSWGLYDSFIMVIPSLDIVVSRAGQSWKLEPNADHYDVLKPFLGPIAAAASK